MHPIQVIRNGAFRHDQALRDAIHAVVAGGFAYDPARLDQEFELRDTLYLTRDERGEILGVFMVSWESLEIDGTDQPALSMGVCAARPDVRGTGKVVRLFKQCILDAQQWERTHQKTLVAWATTMNPFIHQAARRLFANAQPFDDGTYTDEAARLARAIRRRLGTDPPADAHPFVFLRLASDVRFTPEERSRIAAASKKRGLALLAHLGIDESQGDRLLIVMGIPDAPQR